VLDGVPLGDRALIQWVASLLDALFPEPVTV
jgi:transcription-repair coupling factor (superfamily II helicase)